MATVQSLQNLRNDLILRFSVGAAIFADYSAPAPADLFDATGTTLQPLPAGYQSAGLTTTDGITTTRNVTMDEVMSWQSAEAQRSDVTADSLTFAAKFQEHNPTVLALQENQLLSAIPALGQRVTIDRTEDMKQPLRRCVLLGYDTTNDVVVARFLPKVKVSQPGNPQWQRAGVTEHDMTLNSYFDYTYGTSSRFFLGGAGWLALQPTPPVLTAAPSSITLSLAATPHTRQLTVTSGATDVTSTATYLSSQPSVATVSAAGLVTAVAVGQSTVTATYSGRSTTVLVTVTA